MDETGKSKTDKDGGNTDANSDTRLCSRSTAMPDQADVADNIRGPMTEITDSRKSADTVTVNKSDAAQMSEPNKVDMDVVKNSRDTNDSIRQDAGNRRNGSGYAPIKPEFLVPDYKPTLHKEYLSSDMKNKMKTADGDVKLTEELNDNSASTAVEAEDEGGDEEEPPSKKAKLKGRNKHRPRNERIQAKDRICPAIKANRECSYGEKCKFSHDKEDFVNKKLPELEGPCYLFDTFGHCHYGIACRFAKNHLASDLQNITNEELYNKMKNCKSMNELSADVRQKLWKKKYNFKKADLVVKNVQRDFRGWGDDKCRVGEEASEAPEADGDANRHGHEESMEKSLEHASTSTDELPAANCQTKSLTDSAQLEGPENLLAKTDEVETEKRIFGCITDEEVIKIHAREKLKIDFKDKLYLAPLTTVGNLPFRRVCKGLGADVTCGEMALVTQLLKGKQSEWSLIKRHPCEDIFGVQICGSYPDSMTRCAQLLTETCNVDFIDINCGCPIDLVFKKGSGSALMGKATKLEQICRSMIGVMGETPLTVKLRTGVFDNKSVAHQIVPRLRDAGVSLVTVHGRSREQRYTKQADWDYISQCVSAGVPMPVFGNGDILSFEEANLHRQHSGVSGVMIARGALIKPWIFTEIKEQRHWDISSGERLDLLRTYTNYGLEHWGSDHQGVENTRRFLLEWLSFLHRYIPVGVLEQVPQRINERPPYYVGRNDLETLMASANCADWIKISEMLLGPVPPNFQFLPKHKANAYQ